MPDLNFWQLAPRNIERGAPRGMALLVAVIRFRQNLQVRIKDMGKCAGRAMCQGNVSRLCRDVRQLTKGEPSG